MAIMRLQRHPIVVMAFLVPLSLFAPCPTGGSWLDASGWFGGCYSKEAPPGTGETVIKPDLHVRYSHFRKMLQQSDKDSNGTSLDPCRKQDFIVGFQYTIAVLQWPGSNVTQWLDEGQVPRNPCTDQDFSDMLASDKTGAFIALFSIRPAELGILRMDLDGDAVIQLLVSKTPVTTMSVYNLEAISFPSVTTSLDPDLSFEAGIAAFLPVVVRSQLRVPSLFANKNFTLGFQIYDSKTCEECEAVNEEVLEIMQNGTDFFSEHKDHTDALELRRSGSFNFTCINNATCAWGLGFCASCFQVLLKIRVGTGDYENFHEVGNRGIQKVLPNDIRSIVEQFEPECLTTCSTHVQIGFYGNDLWGQSLYSAAIMRETNGFDWIRSFNSSQYFGLPPKHELVDKLRQAKVNSEPVANNTLQ